MNAKDLRILKEWREREETNGFSLAAIRPPLALAFHDFLSILSVGNADIAEVMGEGNMIYIHALLAERPHPVMDEGVKAYRSAKTLFEPEKGLEEYGLIPTMIDLPSMVWESLDETKDEHFVVLGPIVLDQDTRTVWVSGEVESGAMHGPISLAADQTAAAVRAMKEADEGMLEVSAP